MRDEQGSGGALGSAAASPQCAAKGEHEPFARRRISTYCGGCGKEYGAMYVREDLMATALAQIADPESLLAGCLATLLFHSGGPWDAKRRDEWRRLTGSDEATTKVLCDTIRRIISASASEPEPKARPA